MPNPSLIVACDGGGMRGLITAMLLDDLQKRTGFLPNVTLFTGTSTGSFIALGLASGRVTTSDMISLYEQDGEKIFTPYTPPSGVTSPAVRRIAASRGAEALSFDPCSWVSGMCYAMYMNDPASPLYATLSALLTGSSGAPLTLAELKTPAVVTTSVLWDAGRKAWAPALVGNLPGTQYGSMPAVDAALSSGAAPIYFPPYWNDTLGSFCADGGMFANNPASVGVTALLLSGTITVAELGEVRLLSLGTGVVQNGMPPSYINGSVGGAQNMGILQWFASLGNPVPSEALIGLMFDAVSDIDSIQMQALLGSAFQRPQGPVLTQPYALNDWKDYQTLVGVTNDYIQGVNGQPRDWASVVEWVGANFT